MTNTKKCQWEDAYKMISNVDDKCNLCGETGKCLEFDNSCSEYEPITICHNCLTNSISNPDWMHDNYSH